MKIKKIVLLLASLLTVFTSQVLGQISAEQKQILLDGIEQYGNNDVLIKTYEWNKGSLENFDIAYSAFVCNNLGITEVPKSFLKEVFPHPNSRKKSSWDNIFERQIKRQFKVNCTYSTKFNFENIKKSIDSGLVVLMRTTWGESSKDRLEIDAKRRPNTLETLKEHVAAYAKLVKPTKNSPASVNCVIGYNEKNRRACSRLAKAWASLVYKGRNECMGDRNLDNFALIFFV